jgi:hypothetical protein
MRFFLVAALCAAVVSPAAVGAQTRADSSAIRQTALDYIEGWWQADASRMARALHPELAKRIVFTDSVGGQRLRDMTASELVYGTRAGGGSRTPAAERRSEVTILDVFNNAASVRVDAGPWVDYMHLARWSGRWVIVNVLWELRAGR